jgi:hypothetical protein
MITKSALGIAMALAMAAPAAQASCGSAYCPVNTHWDLQSAWTSPGWRFDLRHEIVDLDQPRHGSEAVDVGEIRMHHDEVETQGRNTVMALRYSFDERWGLALSLPHVARKHEHIHHHHGQDLIEKWDLSGLGDARLLGQYRIASSPIALQFGLKLPTGKTDERNADDDLAERSLQLGTGTTDAVIGVSWRHGAPASDLSWFAQTQLQYALGSHDDFRPGNQFQVDAGLRYRVGDRFGLLLQTNYVATGRDRGNEAETDHSGSRLWSLSPGLSLQLTDMTQAYLFLQHPLVQHVNGVQLTADRSLTAGMSFRF